MIYKSLVVVTVFTLVCLVRGDNKVHTNSDRSEFKRSLGINCDDSYSFTCLKLDAVSWVDRISNNDNISFLPGVTLVKENNSAKVDKGDIVSELAREFPDDPNARLDGYLMKKFSGFLDNHSIKLNLRKVAQAAESTGTARAGGKKGGGGGGGGNGLGAALALGAMMKSAMLAMGLAGVAALAGKALMASLAALLLAALASLKGHGGGGGGHTTQVIAKPSYEGWDSHGHKRSFDNSPLPIALQPGYQPA